MAVRHVNFAGKTAVGQEQPTKMISRAKKVQKHYPEATLKRATLSTKTLNTGSSGGGRTADGTKYGAKTYGAGLGISKPATKKVGKVRGH